MNQATSKVFSDSYITINIELVITAKRAKGLDIELSKLGSMSLLLPSPGSHSFTPQGHSVALPKALTFFPSPIGPDCWGALGEGLDHTDLSV